MKLSTQKKVATLGMFVLVTFLSFSSVFAAGERGNGFCDRVSGFARRSLMGSARAVYGGTRRVEAGVQGAFLGGFGIGRAAGRLVGREEAGGMIGLAVVATVLGGAGATTNALVASAVGEDVRNLLVIGTSAALAGAHRLVRDDEERRRIVEDRRTINARVARAASLHKSPPAA